MRRSASAPSPRIPVAVALLVGAGCAPTQAQAPVTDTLLLRGVTAGSYVVTRLPRPVGATEEPSTYVLNALNGFTLVPELGPGPSGDHSDQGRHPASQLVTIAIPDSAAAGAWPALRILGYRGNVRETDRTVLIEVARRDAAGLAVDPRRVTLTRGGDASLAWSVRNDGNAPLSLTVEFTAPSGWRADPTGASIQLAAGERASGIVQLTAPTVGPTGYHRLRVVARSAVTGDSLDAAIVGADVYGSVRQRSAGPGVGVLVGVTGTAGASGREGPGPVLDLAASGPLAADIRLDGRLAVDLGGEGPYRRGLAAVGTWTGGGYLTVSTPGLRATAGDRRLELTPLTGTRVWGRGLDARWEGAHVRAAAFGARPSLGGRLRDGRLAGARFGARAGPAWMNFSAVDLRERADRRRELSAWALDGTYALGPGLDASAGVVDRTFGDEHRVGWSLEAERRSPAGWLRASFLETPGGRATFADAERQVGAQMHRTLSDRLAIEGGFFDSHDGGLRSSDALARRDTLDSRTWTLGTVARLGDSSGVGLRFMGQGFESRGMSGRFRSAERGASATGYRSLAGVRLDLGGRLLRGARDYALPGRTDLVERRGWSSRMRASMRMGGWAGILHAGLSVERSDVGIGRPPREIIGRVSMSDFVVPWIDGARLDVSIEEVRAQSAAGYRRTALTVVTPLPGGAGLSVHLERNPYRVFAAPTGRWLVAVRVERALSLPSLGEGGRKGLVYVDSNGNGRRDEGEAPLGGVLVRQGRSMSTTDARGHFPRDPEAPRPVVEPGTLSPTLRPPPTAIREGRDGAGAAEIGLIPLTRLTVEVVRVADELDRVPAVAFADLRVTATDVDGKQWTATPDSAGIAVFPGLPPGTWRIVVVGSRPRLSFSALDGEASVVIDGSAPIDALRMRISPRPVSMQGGRRRGRGKP